MSLLEAKGGGDGGRGGGGGGGGGLFFYFPGGGGGCGSREGEAKASISFFFFLAFGWLKNLLLLKNLLNYANSPANSEAARMFSENKREYNRRVREIVEQSWTVD